MLFDYLGDLSGSFIFKSILILGSGSTILDGYTLADFDLLTYKFDTLGSTTIGLAAAAATVKS